MEEYFIGEILGILRQAFSEVPVFTEAVRQGCPAPCFFLLCKGCKIQRELGRRFRGEGEFLLRAEPEARDAMEGARWLDRLEGAFQGRKGFSFSPGQVSPENGTAEGTLAVNMVGFWMEKAPPVMEKLGMRLELGGAEKEE